jgi:hypothetical protein
MTSWKMAASATLHCLTGCAIGEVLGMIISTAFSWASAPSIVLSIVLAFVFGYGLTLFSIRSLALPLSGKLKTAFASDTTSISVMEIADNAFVLAVPGAIHAGLNTGLFWWSLLVSLAVAFTVAWPVNKWLIGRGKGHAVVHQHHAHHDHSDHDMS